MNMTIIPATKPAAINIVKAPISLLLDVKARSISRYAPITDTTAPAIAKALFRLRSADMTDAAVMPMPANISILVRDSVKSSFVNAIKTTIAIKAARDICRNATIPVRPSSGLAFV